MNIREVAAAAARNQNLFADLVRALQHRDLAATLTGFHRTQQSCRASAEHDGIKIPMFTVQFTTITPSYKDEGSTRRSPVFKEGE